MRPITGSRTLPFPRETLFAFIADSTNDPLWCPLVPVTEQVDGDGPGFGARYRYVQKTGKTDAVEGIITVTDYEPPHRIEWRVEDAVRSYRIIMTFDDVAGGTRVTQVAHPRFKGKYRILAMFARGKIESMMAKQFARLERHLVESGVAVLPA